MIIDRALKPIIRRLQQVLDDAGLPNIAQRVLIRPDGTFSESKVFPHVMARGERVTYGPDLLAKERYGENSEQHYAARILSEYRAVSVNAAHGNFDLAIYVAYQLGVLSSQAELLRDADRGYASVANLHRLGTVERQQRRETWKRLALGLAVGMRQNAARQNTPRSDAAIAKRIASDFKSTSRDTDDRPPGERTIRKYLSEG